MGTLKTGELEAKVRRILTNDHTNGCHRKMFVMECPACVYMRALGYGKT